VRRVQPLKRPAVDKEAFPVDFQHVFGARIFLRRPKRIKLYVNGLSIMRIWERE